MVNKLVGLFFFGIFLTLILCVNKHSFQTDLFSLLPDIVDEHVPKQALNTFADKLSRRTAFLLTSKSASDRQVLSERVHQMLTNSGLFESIQYKVDDKALREVYDKLMPFRFYLLSTRDFNELNSGGAEVLSRRLLNALVSPLSTLNSSTLTTDPFGLYSGYLAGLQAKPGRARLVDGLLQFSTDNHTYLLVTATLKGSAFDQDVQDRFAALLDQLQVLQGNYTGGEVLVNGIIRHALANRTTAQNEIAYIGTGSLLAIFLLFYLVFKRIGIFLYLILPLAMGLASGLAASLLLFGQIHIITLVFGASLIGVSIDYTFHYCCSYSSLTDFNQPGEAINHIRPSLTLGLLTSIIGYLTLATTEFPALKQMAVFSAFGLVGTYLSVLVVLPLLINKKLLIAPNITSLTTRLLNVVNKTPRLPMTVVVILPVILIALIALTSRTQDDVKLLRTEFPELNQIDQQYERVLGEQPNSQYYVVFAESESKLLDQIEMLAVKLEQVQGGRILALTDWIPSPNKQSANHQLLKKVVLEDKQLSDNLNRLGMPAELLATYRQQLQQSETHTPTVQDFLTTQFGQRYADLWLGKYGDKYYSLVMLFGYGDIAVLQALADENEHRLLIDRTRYISGLFSRYRTTIEYFAPFVLAGMILLLSLRYGLTDAIRVVAVPLTAALSSLILVVLAQGQYDLFNLFGLIVTLAIAIDYAIFIRENRSMAGHVYLAVTLSALTTIISLGLLGLSRTPALHSFGISLWLGVMFSFVLAPIVIKSAKVGEH